MLWLTATALAADVYVRVRERGSGDPVAAAAVWVDESPVGFTDARGIAVIDVNMGTTVTVRPVLHQPITARIENAESVTLYVLPARQMEIVVESFRTSSHTTRHTLDAELAIETPGALDDSIRLIQALPGVTVQREYSPGQGTLSVRGSAPGDNRYYLDGVEVPYLYHYNQYASVVPTSQLDWLEVYPSTFGASYGNAVGAVVEAESKRDAPEVVHGDASLNFVMVGGDVRTPLGKDWWAAAAGRRSYFDAAGRQSEQYPVFPRFHDFLVRVERGDGDRGTGFSIWGAGDGYERAAGELDVLDPVERTQTPRLDFGRRFEVFSGSHRWSGDASEGRFVVAAMHHRRASTLRDAGAERLNEWTLSSRLDARKRAAAGLTWEIGYELQQHFVQLDVDAAGSEGLLVAEEAPALARGVSVDDRLVRTLGAMYTGAQAAAGPVQLMPGARVGLDSVGDALLLEPRLAMRVRAGAQTALKAAAGRYQQRPASEQLIPGTGDWSLPTTSSWQVSAGIEQTVADRLELGLDGYRKWIRDPVFVPVDRPPEVRATADAWGVELLTRYRVREVFFVWGWVAVAGARLETTRGRDAPADGDQRVSAGAVASWDVGRWNFGARLRYATGLPYTQLRGSLYDGTRDSWVPIPGRDNAARFPPYAKLDLRVAHTWIFNRWSLTASGELWLVPPTATQLYPAWSFDYSEEAFVHGPPALPLLGVNARF